jgi:N-acetyl-anhydromuramyl-L-alanine amidase AmpD
MAGREESPDTTVVGSREPVTGKPFGAHCARPRPGATRQVTPGERFRWYRFRPALSGSFTESATENRPPAEQHGDIAQVNLRDVFEMLVSFGKGEKVG